MFRFSKSPALNTTPSKTSSNRLRQDSWLAHARTAFSMCSGVGTAESSRAVLQKIVNSAPCPSHPFTMNIQTVALWESQVATSTHNSKRL